MLTCDLWALWSDLQYGGSEGLLHRLLRLVDNFGTVRPSVEHCWQRRIGLSHPATAATAKEKNLTMLKLIVDWCDRALSAVRAVRQSVGRRSDVRRLQAVETDSSDARAELKSLPSSLRQRVSRVLFFHEFPVDGNRILSPLTAAMDSGGSDHTTTKKRADNSSASKYSPGKTRSAESGEVSQRPK